MRNEASRAADMVVNQLLATIDGVNDGSVFSGRDGSDFVQNVAGLGRRKQRRRRGERVRRPRCVELFWARG